MMVYANDGSTSFVLGSQLSLKAVFFSRSPLKQEECVAKNKITTLHSNFERFVFTISIDVTLSLSAFQNEWLSLGH